MKYQFTAEEQDFRQEVKDFLSKEWADDTFAVEGSEEWWDEEKTMRKKLADQGWLALSWPKEYGGGGRDPHAAGHLHRRMVIRLRSRPRR